MRYSIFFILFFLPLTSVVAQRDARVPDPDPEIERRSFQVAEGFEVNLFASDPKLTKPIQMNFDAQGRLWLACSETYPQIKPGQKANDRILVLEDTRGAGKADKVTVFAEGLLIPTGVEPGDGGAYVANSTDLLHLQDTDGDGKADRKRVVLSGFGTEDTHHILHTLRWGHDGNLYFNQSVYIHSHIETPHGPRRLNAGGIWQLRPESLKLEVYVRGFWNSWGHHFDRYGQSFLTDGAGFQGVAYGFPGAAYEPSPEATRFLKGLNFGSPKYCGLEIVSGRHLPEDWQGNLLTCDFRAHRVCRFVLSPAGSGYTARLMPDVIRATHPAFRPIDVKMGPDGAIYIADWYNPIIQHGEVDFRDPRRDITHGRIWRLTAKGRKLVDRPNLMGQKPAELVKQLEAPEGWTRHFARRVLKERHAGEAKKALDDWVRSLEKNGSEEHLLEALWTYQTLDLVETSLLGRLLEARDPRIRAASVRVLSAWQERVPDTLSYLEKRIEDAHPQVRLEAVRALGQLPQVRAAELALRALRHPLDEYLDYGVWLTMRELESVWLPALEAGTFDFGKEVRFLAFALQAVGSQKVVAPLSKLVRSGKLSGETETGVWALLAKVGGPAELAQVLAQAAQADSPPRQIRLLAALEETAKERGLRPAGEMKEILPLLQAREEAVQATAARLAGLWRRTDAQERLLEIARDAKASLIRRKAAIEGLASLGGQVSKEALVQMVEKEASVDLRRAALIALTGIDLARAAALATALLQASKEEESIAELFAAFLERKGGAAVLAKALTDKKLPGDVARIGVRAARVSGRPATVLIDALTRAGGLTGKARTLSAEELRQLVAEVSRSGDPQRGEKIYRRPDQLCQKCHALGGAGGQVGPDLSSIGASAQIDYLIESLLQPSKAIKENYHSLLVTTIQGQQYTGIKARQTPTTLVLRNDQDKEVIIPLKDVEEQAPSKTSLMPEGLTDALTRSELIDLVRFLSELGKSERWSVSRQKFARRWQVLQPKPEVYRLLNRQGMNALVQNPPELSWEPIYATVSGGLTLGELPTFRTSKTGPAFSLIQTQLEATSTSAIHLKLSSSKGLTIWLDGEPISAATRIPVKLKAGLHTLSVTVDHSQADNEWKLEIEDTPAAASVRFLTGK